MLLRTLALSALLGSATAATLSKPPLTSALQLRGGALDADTLKQVATGLAYASSGFILLPAGRDIVSPGTNLLPGEDTTRPLMTMTSPSARTFTWGLWGLNHCFLSLLKLKAVKEAGEQDEWSRTTPPVNRSCPH